MIVVLLLVVFFIAVVMGIYWICYRYINSDNQKKWQKFYFMLKPLFNRMDESINAGKRSSQMLEGVDGFMKSDLKNPFLIFFSNDLQSNIDLGIRKQLVSALEGVMQTPPESEIVFRNVLLLYCDLSLKGKAFENLSEIILRHKFDISALTRVSEHFVRVGKFEEANNINKRLFSLNGTQGMYGVFLFLKENISPLIFSDVLFRLICFFRRPFVDIDDFVFLGSSFKVANEAKDYSFQRVLKNRMLNILLSRGSDLDPWTQINILNAFAIVAFKTGNEIEFHSWMKKRELVPVSFRFELDFDKELANLLARDGKKELYIENLMKRPKKNVSDIEFTEFISSIKD